MWDWEIHEPRFTCECLSALTERSIRQNRQKCAAWHSVGWSPWILGIICWLDAIDVGFYLWDKFSPHLMLLRENSEQNRRQSQFSKSMSMQKKTELMSPSTHRWGLARCQQWGLKIERDISPLQSPVNRSLLISSITEKTLLHHIKYWKVKNH